MTLTVIWHKPCWPSASSPSGFAARGALGHPGFGGLPSQIAVLAPLFDAVRIVGPVVRPADRLGELAVAGPNVSVVPLSWLPRAPWWTLLVLPWWLIRNGRRLAGEVARADAVYAFIPSPIGLMGIALAFAFGKPIVTRQLNGWSDRRVFWRIERAVLERIAGGRTVVFATGASDEPPSRLNAAIGWILPAATSGVEPESFPAPRTRVDAGSARLVVAGRELDVEAVLLVVRALPLIALEFPRTTLDVVADAAEVSRLASRLRDPGEAQRIAFHISPDRERTREILQRADLFCHVSDMETEPSRLALHEALASGLPVVASRGATPLAILRDCGMTLSARSAEAVAAAVRAMLSDPSGYRRMSLEAAASAGRCSVEHWREHMRTAMERAWGPLRTLDAERTSELADIA